MTPNPTWTARRLKFLGQVNMGQSPPSAEVIDRRDDSAFLFLQGNAEFGDLHPTPRHACDSPRKVARVGDLLLSVCAPVGALNIADRDYGIGRGLCAISWFDFSPCYGWWALHHFRRQLFEVTTGSTYDAVAAEDVGNIRVTVPPIDTQHRIAHYLNAETAQIDALVAEKERLLALLEEKRTALVSHMVIRGLNLDVRMKPSGLDWLGDIPAHWKIQRCATLFTETDDRNEPELPLLNVSINTGVTLRTFSDDRIESVAEDFTTYKVDRKGQLVFNKMRFWQGAAGIAPVDGLTSPDYTVARISQALIPAFVELLFRLPQFSDEVHRYSYGMVDDRLRLYWDEFKNIRIPVPPIHEQNAIVAALTRARARTAELEASLHRSIALLKERRSALITAAVTGQLEPEAMNT